MLKPGQVSVGATPPAHPENNRGAIPPVVPQNDFYHPQPRQASAQTTNNTQSSRPHVSIPAPDERFRSDFAPGMTGSLEATQKGPATIAGEIPNVSTMTPGIVDWKSPAERKQALDFAAKAMNTPTPQTWDGVKRTGGDTEPQWTHTIATGTRKFYDANGNLQTQRLVSDPSSPTGTSVETGYAASIGDITRKYGARDPVTGLPMQPSVNGALVRDDFGNAYDLRAGRLVTRPQPLPTDQQQIAAAKSATNPVVTPDAQVPFNPQGKNFAPPAGVAQARGDNTPQVAQQPATLPQPGSSATQAGQAVNKAVTSSASNVGTSLGQAGAAYYNNTMKPVGDFVSGLFGGTDTPAIPSPKFSPAQQPGTNPSGTVQPNATARSNRNMTQNPANVVAGSAVIGNPAAIPSISAGGGTMTYSAPVGPNDFGVPQVPPDFMRKPAVATATQ